MSGGSVFAGKELLIFDLDGTLVDSSPLHARAYVAALAPLGVPVDYERIAGMTTTEAIAQLLGEAQVDLAADARDALRRDKQQRALALIGDELEALPGAVDFVAEARRHHLPCALCTSASPPSVDAALRKTGMSGWFSPVITSADVSRGKPDPEGFLLAARHAGVAPDKALVFEDSESGLAAAAAAGMEAIRIGSEGTDWFEAIARLRQAR